MSTPIYYVIAESKPIPPSLYQCWLIIKVIACDFDDTQNLYQREILPLIQDGRNVQGLMFYREPPNMFRQVATEKSVWNI